MWTRPSQRYELGSLSKQRPERIAKARPRAPGTLRRVVEVSIICSTYHYRISTTSGRCCNTYETTAGRDFGTSPSLQCPTWRRCYTRISTKRRATFWCKRHNVETERIDFTAYAPDYETFGIGQQRITPSEVRRCCQTDVPSLGTAQASVVPFVGVLVDTARTYFPPATLRTIIDVLARHIGMNVLQLRLTDDQSFVAQFEADSLTWPNAPHRDSKMVYTTYELRELVEYGRRNGVIILPELNISGHAGGGFAQTS